MVNPGADEYLRIAATIAPLPGRLGRVGSDWPQGGCRASERVRRCVAAAPAYPYGEIAESLRRGDALLLMRAAAHGALGRIY